MFFRTKAKSSCLRSMTSVLKNFYAGTSGLLLPVPNKLFYPDEFKEKSRLCFYASLMNTIEINSSFYKIPLASTVKKWTAEVPADFRFTFKLFKGITHQKHLAFDREEITHFFRVIAGVENKKGCLLVQFPPSIRIAHFAQLRFLMSELRANDPEMQWKIALEFRHHSLYVQETYELLEEHGFGLVIHDKFPAASLMVNFGEDFIYLRFHGPGGNYKGSYEDEVLYEYASYVSNWLNEDKKVYVYFNNTMGDAIANLNLMRQMLRESSIK